MASWQPQGRVKKDKESVNNVVRTAVFFTVDIMQIIFLHFLSQAPTTRGDSAVRILHRSQRFWQRFGCAVNLNALITNTVTLPSHWEIHFVSSHNAALRWQWNCQPPLFLLYLWPISKKADVSCRIEYRCKTELRLVMFWQNKAKRRTRKRCQESSFQTQQKNVSWRQKSNRTPKWTF